MRRCWGVLGVVVVGCGSPAAVAPAVGPPFQVVGDSFKQTRDRPPPATSTLFDGTVVHLRAARGETLGVQVLLDHHAPVAVALTLPADAAAVEAFTVGYLDVVEPSTRMCAGTTGKGSYPDLLTSTTSPVTSADAAFFDVAVARAATPGLHRGTLTVGDREVPVELTVEPLTLDLDTLTSVWGWYKAKQVATTHHVDEGSPAAIELERRFTELFRRHGVHLMTDFQARHDFYAPRRELLARAPLGLVPVKVSMDPAQAAIDAKLHLDELAGTGLTPFAYPFDEPQNDVTRMRVRAVSTAMSTVADGARRVLMKVTDLPSAMYGDAVDIYVHPLAFPDVRAKGPPGKRWWTYNGALPRAGASIIDGPGTAYRVLGWIEERYAIELWFIWEVLYFEDRYNKRLGNDVTTNPLSFDQRGFLKKGADWCNGDGLLAYPEVRPSLRLKALRRGLQDRALVRKLRDCGGDPDPIVRRVVPRALAEVTEDDPTAWPLTEAPFEQARAELLDALVRRCAEDSK